MKKVLVLTAISLFVFSGCKFLGFGEDISPEAALPLDSQYVLTIDSSNSKQVKNLKKLFEMFPDFEIADGIKEYVLADGTLKKNGIDYEKDILPILEGDWKISIAIDFSKIGSEVKGDGLIIAAYVEEDSKMKAFLEKNKEKNEFYGNDGEIFVVASTQAEVDSAIKRLKDGNGFSSNENFKNISKDSKENLGYMYFEMDKMVESLFAKAAQEKTYDAKTLEELKGQMAVVKTAYFEVFAEDDGIGLGGFSTLNSDKDLVAKYMPYFGKKLSLFDKVPLENPILYFEFPNIGKYLGSFISGFKLGLDQAKTTEDAKETEVNIVDMQKDYEDLLGLVASFGGISKEDAKGILESQFAFALGDSGEKYPTISLYFDVDEKYKDAVKKLTGSLDAYVDAIIKEYEKMTGLAGILKKDADVVNGGGLNKLYIDFSVVPAELLASLNFIPGLDLEKMKVEIYYGLTGDNVFTVALYPDFNKSYGKDTIGKNKDVSEFLDAVGKDPSYAGFFSPEKLINFIDTNFYSLAKSYGVVPEAYDQYYLTLKDTMQVLKYFVVSNSMIGDDKISVDAFLKFEEVEKNEALEKVKEGK